MEDETGQPNETDCCLGLQVRATYYAHIFSVYINAGVYNCIIYTYAHLVRRDL